VSWNLPLEGAITHWVCGFYRISGDVRMTDLEITTRTLLEAMLSKSIDDIVRLHREELRIRISTVDGLILL